MWKSNSLETAPLLLLGAINFSVYLTGGLNSRFPSCKIYTDIEMTPFRLPITVYLEEMRWRQYLWLWAWSFHLYFRESFYLRTYSYSCEWFRSFKAPNVRNYFKDVNLKNNIFEIQPSIWYGKDNERSYTLGYFYILLSQQRFL